MAARATLALVGFSGLDENCDNLNGFRNE